MQRTNMHRSMFILMCFLITSCGLAQTIKNTNAQKYIRVGMTKNEVEKHIWVYRHKLEENINTSQGEVFLIKWYRINFKQSRPTPFIYKNDKLIGYGEGFIEEFSAKNGFALYEQKKDIYTVRVPIYPEQKRYKEIGSVDPYLALQLKTFDDEYKMLEELSKDWNKRASQWSNDLIKFKREENKLLKSLNIQHLEIYAKYEDASKNNKSAYKELYLRKLNGLLSTDQKTKLTQLGELDLELEHRAKNLNNEREKLIFKNEDLNKKRLAIKEYISTSSPRSYGAQASQQNTYKVLADGLGDMAETMRRQSKQRQQQFQMYKINNSLQDISRAIRGY